MHTVDKGLEGVPHGWRCLLGQTKDSVGAGGDPRRAHVALMRGHAYLQAANADQAWKVHACNLNQPYESPATPINLITSVLYEA